MFEYLIISFVLFQIWWVLYYLHKRPWPDPVPWFEFDPFWSPLRLNPTGWYDADHVELDEKGNVVRMINKVGGGGYLEVHEGAIVSEGYNFDQKYLTKDERNKIGRFLADKYDIPFKVK